MNERIKILRKELGLSGEKFGERLGVGKTAISRLENGSNNVTDQMFKLICKEFNVNEDWLKNGEGEIFMEYDDAVAACIESMITEDHPFYNIIKRLMVTYSQLKPDNREIVDDFMQQALESLKKEDC